MKALICGAAGLIASHFTRRLAGDHEVLALRRGELDITDAQAIHRHVASFRPDLIVNGAVIQVDEAEIDPAKARAVNVEGPRFLAQAANESGAAMLQFSSQYVFEGQPVRRAPYTVKDEQRPVNNYGKTKLAGERAVSDVCAQSYIIRTSWVYGSGKNSFLCTAHRDLLQGKQLRAITDSWSSTTYVEDLIDRSLEIIAGRRYGIYHVVNEGVCTYHEFAREAGRLVGLRADRINALIKLVTEADMNRPARRPVYTPLRCLLSEELGLPPMRHWKAALAAYIGS